MDDTRESPKARKERLKAAAIKALEMAEDTGRSAMALMVEATGEPIERCHGYITTSPNWSSRLMEDRAGIEPAPRDNFNADEIVIVRRQWNDWRQASYHIDDLSGIHWSDISGGINARAPRDFLHGYVSCDGMIDGDLAHSCQHGQGPHRIKVCIVKKDNPKKIVEELSARAA